MVGFRPFRVEDSQGCMEKFDSPTVKGDGMGIHNSRSVLFESEAQAFVEVLTDSGV